MKRSDPFTTSDMELVELAKAGSTDAYAELWKRHSHAVKAIATHTQPALLDAATAVTCQPVAAPKSAVATGVASKGLLIGAIVAKALFAPLAVIIAIIIAVATGVYSALPFTSSSTSSDTSIALQHDTDDTSESDSNDR